MQGNGIYQVIGLAVAAAIAFWVYTDAKKRPMNAILWAIGTFLVCIVFLPLYLIMRKPVIGAVPGSPGIPPQPMPLPPTYTPPPQQGFQQPPQYTTPSSTFTPPPVAPTAAPPKQGKFCPSCGAPHEGTVKFCPNCGASL